MKTRSAKTFLKIIKMAVEKNPAAPVRFDIRNSEREAVMEAYRELTKTVKDRNSPRSVWDWNRCEMLHADPAKREAGYGRVVFLGPACPRPPKFHPEWQKLFYSEEEVCSLFMSNSNELRWVEPDVKRTREQKKIARNAQQVRTKKQTEAALRLREFIRTEYKKHTPEVLSKEITKGAAYKRIRKEFSVFRKEEMQGADYDIEDDVLEERKTISDSTIRRALAPLK